MNLTESKILKQHRSSSDARRIGCGIPSNGMFRVETKHPSMYVTQRESYELLQVLWPVTVPHSNQPSLPHRFVVKIK